jgi:hypothetical protein
VIYTEIGDHTNVADPPGSGDPAVLAQNLTRVARKCALLWTIIRGWTGANGTNSVRA